MELGTYDDHVDDEQAEIVEDDADLEQVPRGDSEALATRLE